MSPPLPLEIFDLIIDHLHDEPSTLKACCRVSKSWIPRSRGHLFACVEFNSTGTPIDLWMKAFPDPSNSPAHHTRTLCLRDPGIVSTDTRALIRSFCHVQTLSVNTFRWGGPDGISLLPFHGLSPILESLDLSEVHGSMSEIIGLVCSFPLLEDLLFSPEILKTNTDGWAAPPTSPKLTGSLLLGGRNRSIARELLNLPDGLHFSKIRVEWYIRDNDPGMVMDLVSRCSDTLETLYLRYYPLGASPLASTIDQSLTLDPDFLMVPSPLDLSNATELKDLGFRWAGSRVRWITMTLRTVQSRALQRIDVYFWIPYIRFTPTEEELREWHELDHLLVQLLTSRSILPTITCRTALEGLMPRLLPELTRRGISGPQGE